jgi:4-hydroxy-2-oxoheptanedioate aldolase
VKPLQRCRLFQGHIRERGYCVIVQENQILRRIAAGDVAIGASAQMASPESVEMIGHAGYDFVWIDAEHGTMDLGILAHMIRAADACGITTVVRVPDHTPSFILRVLDAGALGILAPRVRNRDEMEALVRAVKYGPAGERGACPQTRAAGHLVTDWIEYSTRTDRETLVWALIEDPEGVKNIEEIVSVPGLHAIMFGAFDLSQALGHPGEVEHPEVCAQRQRVEAAARARGVEVVALLSGAVGELERARDRGAKIVICGNDRVILSTGFRESAKKAMSLLRGTSA